MSNKLQELRKKLQEKETQNNFSNDNALYPFWNIPYSTQTELKPAVVRFLQDNGGLNPERLTASGYSYYRPVASNDTEEGRSQNRRIEIILTPPR